MTRHRWEDNIKWGCGPHSCDSGHDSVVGSSEDNNEPLRTTKSGKILDKLSDYQLFKLVVPLCSLITKK